MGPLTGCEVLTLSEDDDNDKAPRAQTDSVPVTPNVPDTANDRAKIIGKWRVETATWRWSKMTFLADGTRSVVDRATGEKLTRGTWRLEDGYLVVVSDVTEKWSYTITGTTMTVTLPSGTRIRMTKLD
jgi:hypothetical protein